MKKKSLPLMLSAVVLLLASCGTPAPTTNTKSPEATAAPTPTPSPSPAASPLSIGESASLGDWEISVTDFYYTDKIEFTSYTYYAPDEGNQYAVAAVQVTNNGKESSTFLPSFGFSGDVQAKVYYADEYEYSATVLLGVDEDLHDATMNPLTSKEGIIAFSLPDTVVSDEGSLSLTFSAGRDEITFSLR